jgi:hypothetical protein
MDALTFWRAVVGIVCLLSFLRLLYRFALHRDEWNPKTRDYWYALTMWSFAGLALSVEALIRHSPFRYSLVFVSAAAIVSMIGLRRKGGWGSDK